MKTLMVLTALALVACDKAATPLDPLQTSARRTCMDTIEARAVNRSSVSYSADNPAPTKDGQGQLQVALKFSAKNEIGGASSMLAQCLVSADGKTLVSINVTEPR